MTPYQPASRPPAAGYAPTLLLLLLPLVWLLTTCDAPVEPAAPAGTASAPEIIVGTDLTVAGTRFMRDGRPFDYTGVSFFNALYNPTFNASPETRAQWLAKFHKYGIRVLRIWAQWDNGKGFVDTDPKHTLYFKDGRLRPDHVARLKALLTDAEKAGMVVELALFSEESRRGKKELTPEAERAAVQSVAESLKPYRNLILQVWNEQSLRVLDHVKIVRAIDPQRLVTNAPGLPGDLGDDEQNRALDFLTPHTTRYGDQPHWEVAPAQIAGLIAKFGKPVVDDEPARNGTLKFGGPKGGSTPQDHIRQIQAVRAAGGYVIYHHDMFQMGAGDPTVPPHGIPDPEFSDYHRQVFEFLTKGR